MVDPAGLIASWNPGAERIYGFRAEEIIGQPYSLVSSPHDPEGDKPDAVWRIAIAAGRHESEHLQVRKDKSLFWAIVAVSALKDPEGNHVGFGVVTRDITEKRQIDQALRRSEERYRTLFERAPIGIVYADDRSTYLDANESICAMLGYSRDELIGKNATDIVVPDEAEHIESALVDIQKAAGHQRQWRFRRKDGSNFAADVIATKFPDGALLGMIRDVTELRARENEVARLSRLYAALSQVNQAIVWTSNRDELFHKVCQALVEHGGFRLAWIGWHDPQTHRIMPVAVRGDGSGFVASIEVYGDDRPEGRGPTGMAFRTSRSYISNDMHNDPVTALWREKRERHGLRSSAAFPIRVGGEVRGTLSVYGGQPDIFHDREIALLEEAAADLSFALDNFERDEARRQAERAVANEKHFSVTMIESMPGVVYFYDASLRFRRWNKNFETVSGYAREEIAGMHPLDFFSGEDRTLVARKIAEVFELGEAAVQAQFVAKDGTATPYYFTGRKVRFEGQDCLIGMGIDLSERRQAESRLAESERKYRELVEYANSIILRWNSTGHVTFLSEFGQRFFGYAADEIVGRHVIGTLVPTTESTGRDLQQLMDELCAAPETFEQNTNECMKRNGERVWIAWTNRIVHDSDGRLVEILSVGNDITERKRAEVCLREAELRYHTLFEQTPVGVVVIDPITAAIIESNEQAARQLGYTPEEFTRSGVADFEAMQTREETRLQIEKVLSEGRSQFETRQRNKWGEVRDVFVSAQVIELGGRKVIHCIFLDVTERKAAEAEREKRMRAEAADRIKSAFLATMSHELRTPLNSIIGFTGVLLQGLAGPLNGEQHKQLDMVRTSARHLLALVNDVLDISKIEAGQIEIAYGAFSIKKSLAKVVALVSPAAKAKGVALRTIIPSEAVSIVSDERRFEQILLNLLGNAVKFTDRGEVVVEAEVIHASPSAAEPSGHPSLRVRVIDTGIGIRTEDLRTLFQPFRQIDSGLSRKYEGTGLGLAISYRLAELMGGRIEAESQWGEGSTFAVTLPLTRGSL